MRSASKGTSAVPWCALAWPVLALACGIAGHAMATDATRGEPVFPPALYGTWVTADAMADARCAAIHAQADGASVLTIEADLLYHRPALDEGVSFVPLRVQPNGPSRWIIRALSGGASEGEAEHLEAELQDGRLSLRVVEWPATLPAHHWRRCTTTVTHAGTR